MLLLFPAGSPAHGQESSLEGQAALEYLKDLQGEWVVRGGDEGEFGWEFDVTARGNVVTERLKVGTPTEMTTVYYLDDDDLHAQHYCQLQNRPHLKAINSDSEGDLHFFCDGQVGGTKTHDELHMHGVHFQKRGDRLLIWMDMTRDGEVEFQTQYELVRADPN